MTTKKFYNWHQLLGLHLISSKHTQVQWAITLIAVPRDRASRGKISGPCKELGSFSLQYTILWLTYTHGTTLIEPFCRQKCLQEFFRNTYHQKWSCTKRRKQHQPKKSPCDQSLVVSKPSSCRYQAQKLRQGQSILKPIPRTVAYLQTSWSSFVPFDQVPTPVQDYQR